MLCLSLALVASPAIAPAEGPPEVAPGFDTGGRTLNTIEELHQTSAPITVDPATWRLSIGGPAASRPRSLSYDELAAMPRVREAALLVCPGFFEDYAEWAGVPVADLLALAGASDDWHELSVAAVDGYPATFTRQEFDAHRLFLALEVNGQTLPKEHGFPARLVAVEIAGGRWVKWVGSIEVR